MFRHTQLETVKAWLIHPDYAGLPLHSRIQRAIRQLILDGALAAGKPLPATRGLAASLSVSRDTVENAYGQLHAEGFVIRRVGSGSFVAPINDLLPVAPRTRPPSRETDAIRAGLSARGAAMVVHGGTHSGGPVRLFQQGLPETRNFPIRIWERLERQVLKEHGTAALVMTDPQGARPLRQAIADYVNLERGARATADRVLILTSSQQAMALTANLLLDPGERIFVEDPGYHGARQAFAAAGAVPVPVPLDREGLIVRQMFDRADKARVVSLTPSHQFPTGATLSLERRLALIDWAARRGGWIIEDDYDSEFHYAGRPTACVQGLDPHDRTIYIGTFTKSLFPGLRIGYLILPPDLVAPFTIARTQQDGHPASIAQLVLARFIQGGHFGAHIRLMRNIYAERMRILARLIEKDLAGLVEARVPSGGLQMPCLLTCDLAEARVVNAAARAGLGLTGLTALHATARPQPGFLMGFAAFTPTELESGVHILARVLHDLKTAAHPD
ncbi:PLP-dependent aminotransferase family protein (plasmid) [Gemmobacter fulvus]|uniref:PLP-dependent aminotransferase family protein n=1 Tax=Gemmobacter fulvus TaxID=2840474 RepID=A0A975S3M1_9RHOB|nr:PLP-dependent aminotransferase family protein [Gemmobacter fulvus]MBT9247674.1 PLP-dependent aminotransferase family protein [Gemmobacter fulvus]QWK92857.1 PLP-dependent aminotransferase family protein [Gemmobacter fulvus]